MKDIFVVTHAESVHHVEKKVGGWYDTGLTRRGIEDANTTAERLEQLVGGRDAEIISSDLQRASQTALIIARRLNLAMIETADLREIRYGIAEGQPQAWLDERYIPAPDHNRLDHHVGIEGAETRRQAAARVYPCVNDIIERPCNIQIIVTHGFTLSLVIAAWMRLPIDAIGFVSFPARSGSITHLQQDDFWRNRSVRSLADTVHLQ